MRHPALPALLLAAAACAEVEDPADCADVLAADPGAASGVYSIDPDGDGGWAYQAFSAGRDNGDGLGVDFFDLPGEPAQPGGDGALYYR